MGFKSIALAIGLLLSAVFSSQQAAPTTSEFAGSTPCGAIARRFLGIPASAQCERITWTLRLAPESFEIDATYGMQAVNDPGFHPKPGQTRVRGTWTREGPLVSYIAAHRYRLTSDGRRALEFALIDGVLFHPLDARGDLLRGDAGWSYTLTRPDAPAPQPRRLQPLTAAAASAAGDFEGRTACVEISQMLELTPAADCKKLKWGLTLLPDGTYKMDGTLYRSAPRTGSWKMQRDQATGATVYVLDPGAPSAMSLLKAGPDVLFFLDAQGALLRGNAAHSYTLNLIRD
jgi:hypothetical protein